jgi:hypothetical protein
MADIAPTSNLDRATWLARRQRWRKAGRAIALSLSDQPDDARALALSAMIDAELKRISTDDALAIIDDLAAGNPDNPRLRVMACSFLASAGRLDEAITRLRSITTEIQDFPWAHEVLANLLGSKRANWGEAWLHYKVALQSGPLSSPCMKASAYRVGKHEEPAAAQMALRETSGLELAVVKTRSLGRQPLFIIFAVLGLAGIVIGLTVGFVPALAPLVLASAWGGWALLTSYYAVCQLCVRCWLMLITLLWVVAVVGLFSRLFAGSLVVGGIIGLLSQVSANRTRMTSNSSK